MIDIFAKILEERYHKGKNSRAFLPCLKLEWLIFAWFVVVEPEQFNVQAFIIRQL